MLLNGVFFGVFTAGVYKSVALNFLSDHVLTTAGAFGSICNGGSRIMWASLQDKYGFKKVYCVIMVLQLIISATTYYVRKDGTLYIIWVSIAFLCEGGHFSMFPTAAVKLFGIQNGGFLFTIMFFFIPLSSIIGFLIIQFGQDYISFEAVYQIAAGLSGLNLVLLYFFNENEIISRATKKYNEKMMEKQNNLIK